MTGAELLIATLLVAVAALGGMARYISVPYPILLVLSGAALGFVPGLPEVELDPDAVLLIFLPPLLYGAAIFANFGDMRADTRALTMSSREPNRRDQHDSREPDVVRPQPGQGDAHIT